MPRYDYYCPACREQFETLAGVNERFVRHVCGSQAERRPFSGIPNIQGETVARQIPEYDYRFDAEKRAFQADWGGNDRSVELLRKHSFDDEKAGWKMIDTKGMKNESA